MIMGAKIDEREGRRDKVVIVFLPHRTQYTSHTALTT